MHYFYITDICAYNISTSPCTDQIIGWVYNSETEQCQFGGCEGRGNIFTSMSDCVRSCGKLNIHVNHMNIM